MPALPTTTQSWHVTGTEDLDGPISDLIKFRERRLPKLKMGQCLVEIEASPVNPSDVMYIRGRYGIKPKAGDIPGFEGCGRVLSANAGPYGWWLRGKRVAVGAQDGNGTWSKHVVVSMFSCIPVNESLSVADAATLFVNPMTAIGMVKRARNFRSRAIVMNAAGAALGRYVLAQCKKHNIRFIGTVRNSKAAEQLLEVGADHVLLTSDADYLHQLAEISRRENAKVLFDAVANAESAAEFSCMPDRSLAIVYGSLDENGRYQLDSDDLVFKGKNIEGYWLTRDIAGLRDVYIPLLRTRATSRMHRHGNFNTGTLRHARLDKLADVIDTHEGCKILGLNSDVEHVSGIAIASHTAAELSGVDAVGIDTTAIKTGTVERKRPISTE